MSERGFEIAPIAEAHIEAFHAALDAVARERRYLAFLEAPPIERVRTFVRDNIQRGHPQFVATSEGRLVGWCDVIPMSLPIFAHAGVLGIGIVDGFRGRGIGRALMETVIDAAWTFGLTRIELSVRTHNANAISLYRTLGFVEEGRKVHAIRVDGRYEDSMLMALLKSPD